MAHETGKAKIHSAEVEILGVPTFILTLNFGGTICRYSYAIYRIKDLLDDFLKLIGVNNLEDARGMYVRYRLAKHDNFIRSIGNDRDKWIDLYEYLN